MKTLKLDTMRTLKNIFAIISAVILTQSAVAQLNSVHININGDRINFGVSVEGLGEVIVDAYGNVVRVIRDKDLDGNVEYEYYSNFHDHEAGKIKRIGSHLFTYYSSFHDYEAGKIKSIAGTNVKYHSKFNNYESGKIKSVAGVNLDYYSNFNSYEAGKIKSIGKYRYEYFSDFGGAANAGQPKAGYAKVKVDGITFFLNRRVR